MKKHVLKPVVRSLSKVHEYGWRIACILGLVMPPLMPNAAHGAEGPGSFSYEGRIYNEYGEPSSATVKIILRVMDPAGTCVLREEKSDAIDLSASAGFFSVSVGQGTIGGVDPGLSLVQVFANSSAVSGKTESNATCTFSPTAGAGRKLRVIIEENTTQTALTPDVSIGSAPYAIAADSLQGLPPSAFLQPKNSSATTLTQANLESIFSVSRIPALQALADGTSTVYVKKSTDGSASLPSFTSASAPSSPSAGSIWYDSTNNKIKFYDGSASQTLSTATGSTGITSLTVGSNLTAGGTPGGTLTSSGTIDLAPNGVAPGTYNKVTVDTRGRVTAGSALVEADLPTVSTAGKVSGSAITTGTIGGSTGINTTGTVTATSLSSNVATHQTVRVYETTNVKKVTLSAPASLVSDYNLVLPTTIGSSGFALVTDGTGNLSWGSIGGGGGLPANAGSAAAPGYAFGGDTDTGMFNPAPGEIGFSTDSTVQMKINSAGNVGLGTAAPVERLDVNGAIHIGMAAGTSDGTIRWNGSDFEGRKAGAWVSMTGGGGGGGTVTNVTASAPLSVTTGTTTPSISMTQANTSNSGYLSATDWNAFAGKLGNNLTSGNIWVGNGSNMANPVIPAGDVTMTSSGIFNVSKVQGRNVASTAPTTDQVLHYDGAEWAPRYATLGDIRQAVSPYGSVLAGSSCTSGQALKYNSVTDTLDCALVFVNESEMSFPTKPPGVVFASPGGGVPSWRALTVSDIPALSANNISGAIVHGGQSGAVHIGPNGTDNLVLRTNSTDRFLIDGPSGNIGIGTGTPTARLHVKWVYPDLPTIF